MRIRLNSRIHPVGDLIFNPAARRGDPDWRVLYVACGDGGSGDQKTSVRLNPQRLDTVVGKILRIIPDLAEHKESSTVSENGRYRIPRGNPFASTTGARKEIWAYGLRNPHRLSWDVEPGDRSKHHLIATVIGWRTWETVVFIHKGANYGYPLREGTQMLQVDGSLTTAPATDAMPVHVTGEIDFLETREDVDATRIGIMGISKGGMEIRVGPCEVKLRLPSLLAKPTARLLVSALRVPARARPAISVRRSGTQISPTWPASARCRSS